MGSSWSAPPPSLITHHHQQLHQHCSAYASSTMPLYSSFHITAGTRISASRALVTLFLVDSQFFNICLLLPFLGKSPKSFLLFSQSEKLLHCHTAHFALSYSSDSQAVAYIVASPIHANEFAAEWRDDFFWLQSHVCTWQGRDVQGGMDKYHFNSPFGNSIYSYDFWFYSDVSPHWSRSGLNTVFLDFLFSSFPHSIHS